MWPVCHQNGNSFVRFRDILALIPGGLYRKLTVDIHDLNFKWQQKILLDTACDEEGQNNIKICQKWDLRKWHQALESSF